MKKIILFVILILLLPTIAKAELRELRLEKQYNTGYSNVYYMGDYYLLTRGIYNSYESPAFAAMDLDGNYIYEKGGNTYYEVLFDYEYIYYLYAIGNVNEEYDLHLEKYNPKNGDKIDEIIIHNTAPLYYSHELINYEGSIGIDPHHSLSRDFIVKKDLTEYEEVDELNSQGLYPLNPNINYLSEDTGEVFFDYLGENNISTYDLIGIAILSNGYYYTTTNNYDSEIKANIIYANEDLTEYDLIPINNSNLYNGANAPDDRIKIVDIAPKNGSLYLSFRYSEGCELAYNPTERFGGNCEDDTYVQVYKLIYKVETRTDGNGEIKVSGNIANEEDEVTFEVIPNKGYVLSEVKVTDAEGNTVTFTDNKFTMPSSDVLIEAVFIPINPNTKDLINICIVVFIISAVAYVLSSTMKRNKKLTN